MRWFSQLRWPFKPSSVSSVEKSSARAPLLMLESSPSGYHGWLYQQFVEPAPVPLLRNSGKREGPRPFYQGTSPTPNENSSTSDATPENYMSKLVRLARRKDSLLMRVDFRGPQDTTYVLGEKLTRIRVRSLN